MPLLQPRISLALAFFSVSGVNASCTDLKCDISSDNGVDALISNPHFVSSDGNNVINVEAGKGFWWGKHRADATRDDGSTTWACASDDYLHLLPPARAVSLSITYSGAYDIPTGGVGQMYVEEEQGSTLMLFRDSHAGADTGQSLYVPYENAVYVYSKQNEIDRTNVLQLSHTAVSNGIKIAMCGWVGPNGKNRKGFVYCGGKGNSVCACACACSCACAFPKQSNHS